MDSKENSEYISKRDKILESFVNSKYSKELLESLTELEKKAGEVFDKISSKAKENISKEFLEDCIHNIQKEREKDLYKVIEMMPKGALLHAHLEVTGSHETLMKLIFAQENLYYDTANGSFVLEHFEKGENVPKSYNYVPKADEELKELCKKAVLFTKEDALEPNHWEIFGTKIFNMVKVQNTTKNLRVHILDALNCCVNEGVNILQGRVILGICEEHGTGKYISIAEELDIYVEVYEEFKKSYPDFSFKLIHLLGRYFSKEEILKNLNAFLELKKTSKYSDILFGVDLVGDETLAKSIQFAPLLEEFKNNLKDDGHLLTYFLHAGESYFEENDNILDNLILNCPRVGHGINLIKHSYLFDEIKKRKINIEACPLSNQILNYIKDLRHHPLRTYVNSGISVSISSDDNIVYNTKVINDDFFVCGLLMGFNLLDFKQVCFNSIEASHLGKEEVQKQTKIWEGRWKEFCEKLISQS